MLNIPFYRQAFLGLVGRKHCYFDVGSPRTVDKRERLILVADCIECLKQCDYAVALIQRLLNLTLRSPLRCPCGALFKVKLDNIDLTAPSRDETRGPPQIDVICYMLTTGTELRGLSTSRKISSSLIQVIILLSSFQVAL